MIKKSVKLGLLDDKRLFKESTLNEFDEENLKRMQAKMEVFEEETFQRIQSLLKAYAHLQKENVGMQRRITESVTHQNFEMSYDLLRSQFEEYQ